jgi:hypothetical protein
MMFCSVPTSCEGDRHFCLSYSVTDSAKGQVGVRVSPGNGTFILDPTEVHYISHDDC